MSGRMTRGTAAVVLTAVLGAVAGGCSDDGGGVSGAASKAASAGAEVTAAASSLASRGASALASATAEVRRRLDSVKGGVDARDDVKLGKPATDDDGRTTVRVTARNTADGKKSFAVQVDFLDGDGNLLDTVLVTVRDVAAGASGEATARSTHPLSGSVQVRVATALRY
ncbi:FxLYD domain-containing protein [Streptomyces griseosporeus]|uniref:FxLYD domain-containing protein n=1 Tax=Streptomyces griseosporeus TaxID=1910 RepID=UPI0036FC00FD